MSEKNARRKRKEHQVLAGHRREGSTFSCLPPNTEAVSYVEYGVPELVWIAVVSEQLGIAQTANVIATIGEAIRTEPPEMAAPPLLTSFLAKFPAELQHLVIRSLDGAGLLTPTRSALAEFISLYPKFPAAWLSGEPSDQVNIGYLEQFKILLGELLDKTSARSTFVLANLMYGSLVSGSIVAPPGSFDNLDEVRNYPDSESSKLLAASLRSMATLFIGQGLRESGSAEWSEYFWQRGFDLEPVDYASVWRQS